ncbi:ABC transporter permease, partial [Streptomyces sp. SID14478]|nr:ABC transporter permease [Streptomyces sp. SID14478]
LAGIDGTRDRAALLRTGADARVESDAPLSGALSSRVRRTLGVDTVTPVTLRYDAEVLDGSRRLPLAAVDPAAYGRLARHTGLGAFPEGALKATGRTVPALVSPSMAELFADGRLDLWMNGETVPLRIAAVRATTPALSDDFLIVDDAALARATGVPSRPTTLLLTGSGGRVDAAALRKAAGSGP